MSTTYLHNLLFALGFLATATLTAPVMAQSGKRAPAGNTKTTAQGGSSTKTEVTVALNGYPFRIMRVRIRRRSSIASSIRIIVNVPEFPLWEASQPVTFLRSSYWDETRTKQTSTHSAN